MAHILTFSLCMYIGAYNESMSYQWDTQKAAANFDKHGIYFADAVSIFSDDLAVTVTDERFDEERFITIGMDLLGNGNRVRL